MILLVRDELGSNGLAWEEAFPRGAVFSIHPSAISSLGIALGVKLDAAARLELDGAVLRLNEIEGILALAYGFVDDEFVQFEADSKAYAASEANAVIGHMLRLARCRKVNPPRPGSFSGPAWAPEYWFRLARDSVYPVPGLSR